MWIYKSYTIYTVYFGQIPNLQNCFTTPNKNLGGEEASGFSVFKAIWSMQNIKET